MSEFTERFYMNRPSSLKRLQILSLTPLLIVILTGCGEKKDETPTAITPTEPLQTQSATPQQSTIRVPAAVEGRVAEVQQALKVKDYDRALDTLWSPQPASNPITPEQAAKLNVAMNQLQAQLAAAAAAGDTKAIAARERLRLRSLQMP